MTQLDATATKKVIRAVIYARVSTLDQADEGTSLDTQVARGAEYVDQLDALLVGEPLIERGVSGSLASRPRLDHLVRLIEDDEVDVVVITKLDRIARSLKHLLDLLELFETHNVRLVALDDPMDPSTASGRAMVQLRGVFAELERQLIRERTSEGIARRLAEGCWLGGPAPYGFEVIKNPDGPGSVLVINEDEAAVIRLAHQFIVIEGRTTGEAAEALNILGSQPRTASRWTAWNLRRLLLDGRGLSGRWPWRRAGRQRQGPNGQPVVGTNADEVIVEIPPILTTNEHEQLLAALHVSAITSSIKRRAYLLTSRVKSPHGTNMQGHPTHSGDRWYRCPHRRSAYAPNGEKCECRSLHADTVETLVWDQVTTLLSNPAGLEALAESYEATRRPHAALEREQLAEVEEKIQNLEARIGVTAAGLSDEGVDPGAIAAAVRVLNERLVGLRKERDQLVRLRSKNLAATTLSRRLRALAARATESLAKADFEMRRRILALLALRVDVTGWESCTTCYGSGLLTRQGSRRRGVWGSPDDRRTEPLVCPDCLRTRHIPTLRITGEVPEALMLALAGRSAIPESLDDQETVPFSADVRVA